MPTGFPFDVPVVRTLETIELSSPVTFGATIYTFDRAPPEQIAFENLEHVNLTRAFLNNPGSYLRRLT
jgi:predicted ATPase